MKRNEAVVFVAGHAGMVGAAIVRRLTQLGYSDIVTADRRALDLRVQADVQRFFASAGVSHVVLAAAKVGGIHANNTLPAEFLYENLQIETNVIGAAHAANVQSLLFLGSSCIYPRLAAQPISEAALLTGTLEPTNEPYAIAKIAGIKLCESFNRQYGRDYRSVMPTNLYGPCDNFHASNSHVIPALLRRFHEAQQAGAAEVTIWGTGAALRDFLHVDDMAAASVYVLELPQQIYNAHTQAMLSHVNVGSGIDCSIATLAEAIAEVTGFRGSLRFDVDKPDGTPRKLLDISRLAAMGWEPTIALQAGLRTTYDWFVAHAAEARQ